MEMCKLLRQSTQTAHAQVESLPFTQAMARGDLSREQYLRAISAILPLHQRLEVELAENPEVTPYRPEMARSADLIADIRFWGGTMVEEFHPAISEWAMRLNALADLHSSAWLGALYVVEGSRLGSLMMARPLAKALGVPCELGNGLDYHLTGASHRMPAWKSLCAQMDAMVPTEEAAQIAVQGALATFQIFHDLYASLTEEPSLMSI